MQYSSRFEVVTCKRCLKLIGAQQSSGAATARASVVKPVERRGTVSVSEFDQLSTWDALIAAAQAKADRCARLESLLRELVEAIERYGVPRHSQTVSGNERERLIVAIEAARGGLV